MPVFSYKAYGPGGELAEGQIEAISEKAASDRLWAQKLVPFELTASGSEATPWWRRELFAGDSLSQAQLTTFTREQLPTPPRRCLGFRRGQFEGHQLLCP